MSEKALKRSSVSVRTVPMMTALTLFNVFTEKLHCIHEQCIIAIAVVPDLFEMNHVNF
jgi:hypothetical protein